jgi:hypothetical protein
MKRKAEGKRSAGSAIDHAKGQEMVRTTIWLPRQMLQRLKQISGSGGVSEEIRRRLEASEKAPANPKTRELLSAIAFVAEKAEKDLGRWSENRSSFDVLKVALDLWLTARRPEGEPVMKPSPSGQYFDSSSGHPILENTPENMARFYLAILDWLDREGDGKRG